MLNDIQKRIMELKKEKDVCILAHCYQTHDILEVADFVGDSFGLAQKAAKAPNAAVMMCGVRFIDRKSTRLNSSHPTTSRMPSSA